MPKSFEEWVKDPGIYAGYEDYVKVAKAVKNDQDRERKKKDKKK